MISRSPLHTISNFLAQTLSLCSNFLPDRVWGSLFMLGGYEYRLVKFLPGLDKLSKDILKKDWYSTSALFVKLQNKMASLFLFSIVRLSIDNVASNSLDMSNYGLRLFSTQVVRAYELHEASGGALSCKLALHHRL